MVIFLNMPEIPNHLIAYGGLVAYRADLLTGSSSRAGQRLPGLHLGIRNFCYHSRNRRDFVLLCLEAGIRGKTYNKFELIELLNISRNTLSSITQEAFSLGIIKEATTSFSSSELFYSAYMAAYLNEWRLINSRVALQLREALANLSGKPPRNCRKRDVKIALETAILSRADSVKSDRKHKLSLTGKQTEPDSKDLSNWVTATAFNRDLLILLMAATYTNSPTNISRLMRNLNVARNSLKKTISQGVNGGFLIWDKRG